MLLYLTNVAGIVLAGSLVLVAAGMRPQTVDGRLPRRARMGIAAASAAVLVVAYPLSVLTADRVAEAVDHDDAAAVTREWLEGTGLELSELSVDGDSVHLELVGPNSPPSLEPLADRIAGALSEEITLSAAWTAQQRYEATGAP